MLGNHKVLSLRLQQKEFWKNNITSLPSTNNSFNQLYLLHCLNKCTQNTYLDFVFDQSYHLFTNGTFGKGPFVKITDFFWMNCTNKIYHHISFALKIYLSYCWYWLYCFELLRRSVWTNKTRWFYALFVERAKEPQPWGEEPNSLAPPPPRAGQQPAGCGMASHSSTREFSSRSANAVVSVTPACTAWADPTRGSAGLRSGLLASRSVLSTR